MNSADKFSRKSWTALLIFGLIGQIAWSVENMYFNLFVFEEVAENLSAITLMVQLSGIVATVSTLVFGTLSDKLGNRRTFISAGYIIWGITVGLYGFLSPENMAKLFSVDGVRAVGITLAIVIIGDCVMTLFGSASNDAAFNAWVTDNTKPAFRGKVESILAILPLVAMLIVAGGFGILAEAFGSYAYLFLFLGIFITLAGVLGLFIIKDSETLRPSGSFKDIFFGFRPSAVRENKPLYVTFLLVLVYGIAAQVFMPYLIIYMKSYLGFSVVEYSVVFGAAILVGAGVNAYLGALSDRHSKPRLMYIAAAVMAAGLFLMYLSRGMSHGATLVLFGISGFVMITGYIFVTALSGSVIRDFTPPREAGKLQGVRMIFSVLLPMVFGPMIGNAINRAKNIPLPDAGADAMTTAYIPAPEIFLVGGAITLVLFALIPMLVRISKKDSDAE
jgi:MFS family permease